jgi:outer membrane protein assembly factor BamB
VSYRLINWTTAGTDTNFTTRILSNITYPFSTVGTCDYQAGVAVSTLSYTSNSTGVATAVYIQAASLTSGKLLWNVSADVGYPIFSTSTACADQGKFAVRFDNGFWYCWDLNSGKRLWQSEEETMPWGTFGAYSVASAYGLLYDFSYAGVYALDWNTGKIAWHFLAPCTPFESPWYPSMAFFGVAPQIADGKLYIANGEHSPTSPIARGWKLWCINATSGQGLWNISSRGNAGGISDGYLPLTAYTLVTCMFSVKDKAQQP